MDNISEKEFLTGILAVLEHEGEKEEEDEV